MKINVRLNNMPPGDIRETPHDLAVMAQTVAAKLAELMRIHGIRVLEGRVVQIGSRSVLRKSYVGMVTEPPRSYVDIRDAVVATLADYMSLFGITLIELIPSEDDDKVIKATWDNIQEQAELSRQVSTAEAKTPPTVDPAITPVTPQVPA
jgi:hypothetical protein